MLVGRPCCLEKGIARLIDRGSDGSDRLLVIGREKERMIASIRPSRLGHFLFDPSPLLPISIVECTRSIASASRPDSHPYLLSRSRERAGADYDKEDGGRENKTG